MSGKLSVIKVPNNNPTTAETSKEHPRVPVMYLELLENKDKIKPEYVNREYIPDDAVSIKNFDTSKPIEKTTTSPDTIEEESEISVSDESADDEKSDMESEGDEFEEEYSEPENSEVESDYHQQDVSGGDTKDKLRAMLDDEYSSQPPRLSDLERSGVIKNDRSVPNLSMMDEEDDDEDDEDKKRELLFKFSLLRKSYDSKIEIPNFTIHSNYKRMVEVYENTLRHLSLENSVQNYKQFLIGGFMVCEYVFGCWLNLDMAGYTQAQILNIAQYERLLIELGSKNYTPEAANWPVEFRLVGMIILNAVIFVVSKLILKKTGNNIMNMMNQGVREKYTESFENTTNNFYQESAQEEKKKMKKPSFDFSTL